MKLFLDARFLMAVLAMGLSGMLSAQTVFWSEDFSGGAVPAGWTNVDNGTPAGQVPVTFVWSNNPAAVAPAALGYTASANFNAATAANGYLWANSDRGLQNAPAQNHLTRLTSGVIDCSAEDTVVLRFQALIGVFDFDASTNAIIRVSTDGNNWTDYTPFPCLQTGAANPPCSRWSANPDQVEVNISATAAGQDTVYIQWQWDGGWEYFWAIDDIQLQSSETPLPPNSTKLVSFRIADTYQVPTTQIDSLWFGAEITNIGSQSQDLTLNVNVTDGTGASVFSASYPVGNVAVGDTVIADSLGFFLPANANVDIYEFTYELAAAAGADFDPADNTGTQSWAVTQDLLARDNGQVGVAYRLGGTTDYEIGNFYQIVAQDVAYGIGFSTNWTDLVTADPLTNQIRGKIYRYTGDFTSLNASNFVLVAETSDIINGQLPQVAGAQDYAILTFPLLDVVTADPFVSLTPGYYLVTSAFDAPPTAPADLYCAGAPTGSVDYSFNFNNGSTYINYLVRENDQDQTWGTFTDGENITFIAQLSFSENVGINETPAQTGTSVKLFPNPTSDVLNVEINLEEQAANLVYDITDASGRVLWSARRTNVQRETFVQDVRKFAPGMYSFNIRNGQSVQSTRFVVTK
jgi:hypothetical protein